MFGRLKRTLDWNVQAENPRSLPIDEAYSILANERRRKILTVLTTYDTGEELTAGELADILAERGDDRSACYVSLIQRHLVRLGQDGLGIIDYDPRAKTIRVRSEAHTLASAHEEFCKFLE